MFSSGISDICRHIQGPYGFEPTISECERPQTYALDRAVTETGTFTYLQFILTNSLKFRIYVGLL